MIRQNWKYKLLALGVALILWGHVNSELNPQSQKTFTVPVRAANVAKGYIAELDTPKVSVKIEGLKTAVDAISKDDIDARVEMGVLGSSKKIIEASLPVQVRLPRAMDNDLSITSTPKAIEGRMEALEARKLPVEVSFTSEPPLGFSYINPLLTPDTVTVSGKFTQVTKVSKAILTLFSDDPINSQTEDYYEVMAVDATGNAVAGVGVRPARIKAKLGMIEVPATKAVIVSPVFSGQPKFPLRVLRYTVTPASVTIEGKPSALSGVSAIMTERVMLEGADTTITRDVSLHVPYGAKAVGAKIAKITVYIGTD